MTWARLGGLAAMELLILCTATVGQEAPVAPEQWALLPPLPKPRPTTATSQPAPATRPVAPAGAAAAAPSPTVAPDRLEALGYAGRSRIPRPYYDPSGDFIPLPDRWRIGQPPGYIQNVRGSVFNPYNQNVLKADYPIWGQNTFLDVSVISDTLIEARRVPTPSGVSSLNPGSFRFFGSGDELFIDQNFLFTFSLFHGDASYKPRDWEIRITPVININYLEASELGVTNVDVREGRYREDDFIGFQEAFFEKKLADTSVNYDFASVRAGIQGFTSDFRGFLFSDNEPGVRFFGNYDNNKLQYNVAAFQQLEKDTNSGLNSYDIRDQTVVIANVYRQDFLFPGYTAQLSFHTNIDNSDFELNRNGFVVRPAPIGTIHDNEVRAYYLGWAGDGHIGRVNVTHQFYQVLGTESFNPIAGGDVDINAQFVALELSYDQDWLRYRASFLYASGDGNPTDGTARGFDSIFDNPNFAGGGFSYFTHEAIALTGTGVNLTNRNSLLPDLRTSKEQGQANFVNPGLLLYNVGLDMSLTPRVKTIYNVSWLQFADTRPLEMLLQQGDIDRDIGLDLSVGVQYRPFLNNNTIITVGASALTPGDGFKQIYTAETLYAFFVQLTFMY